MNKLVLAGLFCPLFGAMAQTPPEPPLQVLPPGNHRMGGFHPTATDNPVVQEAKAFIQSQLAAMTLTEVTEAALQVVAGLKVKLVCEVKGADGASRWQFLVFRALDGSWHLQSARRGLDYWEQGGPIPWPPDWPPPPEGPQPVFGAGCFI